MIYLYYFSMYFGLGILLTYLSVFFLSATIMTEAQVTFMMSFVPLISFFSNNFLAYISDKLKKHKLILRAVLLGTIVLSVSILFVSKMNSVILLVIFYVLFSFFLMTPGPLTENFALEYSKENEVPYGQLRLFGSLGFAIAGFTGGILTEKFGLSIIFIIFAICMFIPLLLVRKLPNIQIEHTVQSEQVEEKVYGKLLSNESYLEILLASFLVLAAMGVISTFFGIYLKEYVGLDLKFLGLIVLITAGTEIPMMYVSDRLISRYGAYKILALAAFMNMLRFLTYVFLPYPPFIILVSFTHGIGYGAAFTSIMHLLSEEIPANIRSSAISLNSTLAIGMGTFLISMLGSTFLNSKTVFILMAVVELVGLLFCLSLDLKRKKNSVSKI